MKKQILYWSGLLFLTAVGVILCLKDVLPIKNTTIFFLGLYWLWRGISTLFRFDISPQRTRTPKGRAAYAALDFGVSFFFLSLSVLSQNPLPALLVLLVFILLALWFKNSQQD